VKSPHKLQQKLVPLLRNSRLHIQFPYDRPWTDLELRDIASVVEDYVNRDPEVINSSPLKDWIDEYRFMRTEVK
jgi:hypothetical protein